MYKGGTIKCPKGEQLNGQRGTIECQKKRGGEGKIENTKVNTIAMYNTENKIKGAKGEQLNVQKKGTIKLTKREQLNIHFGKIKYTFGKIKWPKGKIELPML